MEDGELGKHMFTIDGVHITKDRGAEQDNKFFDIDGPIIWHHLDYAQLVGLETKLFGGPVELGLRAQSSS
jgi:hypothetical protein